MTNPKTDAGHTPSEFKRGLGAFFAFWAETGITAVLVFLVYKGIQLATPRVASFLQEWTHKTLPQELVAFLLCAALAAIIIWISNESD